MGVDPHFLRLHEQVWVLDHVVQREAHGAALLFHFEKGRGQDVARYLLIASLPHKLDHFYVGVHLEVWRVRFVSEHKHTVVSFFKVLLFGVVHVLHDFNVLQIVEQLSPVFDSVGYCHKHHNKHQREYQW